MKERASAPTQTLTSGRLAALLLVVLVAYGGVLWRHTSDTVGGSDSAGYYGFARMLAAGEVDRPPRGVIELGLDPDAHHLILKPLGWRQAADPSRLAPVFPDGIAAADARRCTIARLGRRPLCAGSGNRSAGFGPDVSARTRARHWEGGRTRSNGDPRVLADLPLRRRAAHERRQRRGLVHGLDAYRAVCAAWRRLGMGRWLRLRHGGASTPFQPPDSARGRRRARRPAAPPAAVRGRWRPRRGLLPGLQRAVVRASIGDQQRVPAARRLRPGPVQPKPAELRSTGSCER